MDDIEKLQTGKYWLRVLHPNYGDWWWPTKCDILFYSFPTSYFLFLHIFVALRDNLEVRGVLQRLKGALVAEVGLALRGGHVSIQDIYV